MPLHCLQQDYGTIIYCTASLNNINRYISTQLFFLLYFKIIKWVSFVSIINLPVRLIEHRYSVFTIDYVQRGLTSTLVDNVAKYGLQSSSGMMSLVSPIISVSTTQVMIKTSRYYQGRHLFASISWSAGGPSTRRSFFSA